MAHSSSNSLPFALSSSFFLLLLPCTPACLPGLQSFQLSNPAVLPVVCLQASLELHTEATPELFRAKSLLLTGYLEALLAHFCLEREDQQQQQQSSSSPTCCSSSSSSSSRQQRQRFTQLTPRDPAQRGCQLSLLFDDLVEPVQREMAKRGVICDVRKPNVIRVSPVPLYNSFVDVYRFVQVLLKSLQAVEQQQPQQHQQQQQQPEKK